MAAGFAVVSNVAAFKRGVDRIAGQLVYAQAVALTKTAKYVQSSLRADMERVFDRPTRWTLNSLYIRPATKDRLVSTIAFKDFAPKGTAAGKYLKPQVYGGGRGHKRFEKWLTGRGIMDASEYCVPGPGARLDGNGNWSGGQITAILSQLQVSPDASQWETKHSRKKAGRKRARVFVPKHGSRLRRGIWMRDGRAIMPIAFFVRQPQYGVRFRFHDLARRHALRVGPLRYREQLDRLFKR